MAGSTTSGRVGMATVNRSWIFWRTSWSASDETNEMARKGMSGGSRTRQTAGEVILTETLGAETTSTTDTVEVRVGVGRGVLSNQRRISLGCVVVAKHSRS